MKVYIAGSFASIRRLRDVGQHLQEHVTVTSRWLNEKPQAGPLDALPLCVALEDLEDIHKADLLIVDLLEPSTGGGRDVEVGYALGKMKQVWTVGPGYNLFHRLARERFNSWDEVYDYMGIEVVSDDRPVPFVEAHFG